MKCIIDFMEEYGFSPTYRELGSRLRIKYTNGVASHLNALIKKGYLLKEDNSQRTLTILKDENGIEMVLRMSIINSQDFSLVIDELRELRERVKILEKQKCLFFECDNRKTNF